MGFTVYLATTNQQIGYNYDQKIALRKCNCNLHYCHHDFYNL